MSSNHLINHAIIRRCTQTHNHPVLHEDVFRSVNSHRALWNDKIQWFMRFNQFTQSVTHSCLLAYSFNHPPSQKSQINNLSHHQLTQPLTLWVISSINYSFTNPSAMHSFTPSVATLPPPPPTQTLSHRTPHRCNACWLNHSLTHLPFHPLIISSLIHPFRQSSTLTANPPTHSITDSQSQPSIDLSSQSIPCWFNLYLNMLMQTLHHQLMLPLILWHLPAHLSFYPSSPIHYHWPNNPLTHIHHTNMHTQTLTFNWPLSHSINISIYQSIDWSMM